VAECQSDKAAAFQIGFDPGGRNATVGLRSAHGFYRRTSIVAMALFLQYWFWFPLAYMLSLSFSATALIGVTADLRLPKMTVVCHCKKGTFAYAKPVADISKKKVWSV
jgi:26S proteasome regulatory subunit N2